jgi:hypothetical protein
MSAAIPVRAFKGMMSSSVIIFLHRLRKIVAVNEAITVSQLNPGLRVRISFTTDVNGP